MPIKFTWSSTKRASNLAKHGLDFELAERVFAGLTYTFEDERFAYPEVRFVTVGLLHGAPATIIHTETADEIRIISFRRATGSEAALYYRCAGFDQG